MQKLGASADEWLKAGYVAIATLVIISIFMLMPYTLAYNHTASVPKGWYFVDQTVEPEALERDDLVIFYYDEPDWAKGRYPFGENYKFLKKVGGLPGEWIKTIPKMGNYACEEDLSDVRIILKHCQFVGSPLPVDSKGQELPAYEWETALKSRELYLYSLHAPNSYDSRYLGPVWASRVYGRATPIITW